MPGSIPGSPTIFHIPTIFHFNVLWDQCGVSLAAVAPAPRNPNPETDLCRSAAGILRQRARSCQNEARGRLRLAGTRDVTCTSHSGSRKRRFRHRRGGAFTAA